jgi:hypothetical protein
MIRRFVTRREGTSSVKAAGPATRRSRRSRPILEALEGRALLSFSGSEHRVSLNPQTTDNITADNASSAHGTSVAVWVNEYTPTDFDIWAQRFDRTGHTTGNPIEVDFSTADSFEPAVAMDASGRFVVTWYDIESPSAAHVVYMREFNAAGVAITGKAQVSGSTSGLDYSPKVAMSGNSFVIAYDHFVGGVDQVAARRYTYAAGVFVGGGNFVVATDAIAPSVAMAPNGAFDIAYEYEYSATDHDIDMALYQKSGAYLTTAGVNTDTNYESAPSVAMDSGGNAVVVYTEDFSGFDGIFANRVTGGGSVGGTIEVSAVFGIDEINASVALAATGGQFVVAYDNDNGTVSVTEMGSDNSVLATLGPVTGDVPAISIDGFDRYAVTYERFNASSGHEDIFNRRALLSSFDGSEQRVSLNPQATDNTQSANASSANGTSVAVWTNHYGGTDNDIWAQRFDKLGHAAGAPIAVDFTTADSYDPRVAMDATGRFVVTWVDLHADGTRSIMMRYFSAAGAPLTNITQVSDTGSDDYNPAVAASNDSLVISWTHQFSSSDTNIDAERYIISGGVPTSPTRIYVNTDTNLEDYSSVAMSPTGKFDIVYDRQFSGSDWDIFGSQYSSTGALLHGFVAINFDSNPELYPSIAMDNAGNAVVAYTEYANGNDDGIYANRWSSSNVVSGRILVHDAYGVGEDNASVALEPVGGQFVVAYVEVEVDNSSGAQVTEMDSNNTPLATLGRVPGFNPVISIDGLDRYLVTYHWYNTSSGHYDVFSRRDLLS